MRKNCERTGKYYKKLSQYFILIYALFATIILFSLFLFIRSIENQNAQNLELSIKSQFNVVNATESLLVSSYNTLLKSPDLEGLFDSTESTQKYAYYYKLMKDLQSASNQFGSISYSLALVSLSENLSTITGKGTCQSEWYFANETNLKKQDVKTIIKHFLVSSEPLFFQIYDDNDQLTDLYILTQNEVLAKNEIIIVQHVVMTDYLDTKNTYYLVNSNGVILSSSRAQEALAAPLIYPSIFQNDGYDDYVVHHLKNTIFINFLTDPSWVSISICKKSSILTSPQVLIWTFLILIILFLFKYLSDVEKEELYKPIDDVVNLPLNKGGRQEAVDEFQILRNNNEKIIHLKSQLEIALKEKDKILSINDAYLLLNGENVRLEKRDDKPYFVVYFLCSGDNQEDLREKLVINPLALDFSLIEDNTLTYLPLNVTAGCMIVQKADKQLVKEIVLQIINQSDKSRNYIVSISDKVMGSAHIHFAYKQAQNIADFSSAFPGTLILTSELISEKYSKYYFYPLTIEGKLINYVIVGNEKAKEMLSHLVHENLYQRNLSMKTKTNFTLALMSTLQRVFQELKKTPEELLGEKILWNVLYENAYNPQTLTKIQELFDTIIDKVHETQFSSDTILLKHMKEYIYHNYQHDMSLQDLSNQLNISPKYCSLLFSKLSNDTFKNFLNIYRIEKAQEVLKNNPTIKIKVLSDMVGFNSSTSFIRVFKKYCGVSPKVYGGHVAQEE